MTEEKMTFRARIVRLQNAAGQLADIAAVLADEVARMEAAQARFESRQPAPARKPRRERRD